MLTRKWKKFEIAVLLENLGKGRAKDRAKNGQYASENGNSAALKRFRVDFPELGESTI